MVTEDHEAGKNRLTQCPLPLRNASINRNMNALGHFIDTDVSIFQPKRAPLRQRRCDNPHPLCILLLFLRPNDPNRFMHGLKIPA